MISTNQKAFVKDHYSFLWWKIQVYLPFNFMRENEKETIKMNFLM